MRCYYELWSTRCTRIHKFHFSSDARECNGVVFRIINSGIYRRLDTANWKNCKRETWTFVERVIIMRLMETLHTSVKKMLLTNDIEAFLSTFFNGVSRNDALCNECGCTMQRRKEIR